MENLEKFKAKRKIVRSSCTRLITRIDTFMQTLDTESDDDREMLSEHLTNLEEIQSDLRILNDKIEELISDEKLFEAEIQNSIEYEESISDSKLRIRCQLKKFKIEHSGSESIANVSNSLDNRNINASSSVVSVNLPKLNIPTFSGDSSQFLEFFNSFTSAIDSNQSLSNVDKFIYLKSFLSGEASKTVAGFVLNDENYHSCLKLLKDRYGKQEHLISCFVNKLLEIEPVKFSSNIKGLRSLYDESEISIRNLQSMGIASDNFGHLLIPILLKQLPHNLVVEFHRKRDPNKTGDVNELMKFIKFEIESREAANAVSGLTFKPQESVRPKNEYRKPTNRNYFPTSAALNTISIKNVCMFCKSNSHASLKCKQITDEQKRYKLKKEGRCYRCLLNKHMISQCNVKIQPCESCHSSQHNFLFCPKTRNKIAVQKQSPEIPEIKESSSNEVNYITENQTVMSSLLKPKNSNNYTTLLQTASVQVESGSKKLVARLLYDSASQKSFIRKDLARALNVKCIRKEKLFIYTFANRNPSEKEFECVDITLRSRFPPFQYINIEALVTDEICGAQLYSNVDTQLYDEIVQEGYVLSDLRDENMPIQVLLGADFMFSTLTGKLKNFSRQLYLQSTLFGDTLMGQVTDVSQSRNTTSCLNVFCSSPGKDLTNLWSIESFLSNKEFESKKCLDYVGDFQEKLEFVDGRYEAPLLWKSESARENLRDNLEVARKRFNVLEKRLKNDESLFERYNAVMQEQLKDGIIEMCNDNCFTGYTMPHRDVFRENSSSTKTRIVYDASSKQGTNCSLNECLLPGENLNANLVDVILKFREHKIGFCGDIARAFLQIQVSDFDRNYLCFLYYQNCDKNQPVTLYHFNRHCFGVTCSPYVLAATIKTHLN